MTWKLATIFLLGLTLAQGWRLYQAERMRDVWKHNAAQAEWLLNNCLDAGEMLGEG